MPREKVTLEELARMVQRGFAGAATEDDLLELRKALTERLDNLDLHLAGYASLWRD